MRPQYTIPVVCIAVAEFYSSSATGPITNQAADVPLYQFIVDT